MALDSALHYGLMSMEEIVGWRSIAPSRTLKTSADAVAGRDSTSSGSGVTELASAVRFPSARRTWLIANADARAESPLETLTRLDISTAGFAVQPQCFIEGVGRVDLLVEGVLVIETDGARHHDNPRAFQLDRDRNRKLERKGFKVLRFTYQDVMGPGALDIAAEVREVLTAVSPIRTSR